MRCVETVFFAVTINGKSHIQFLPQRGLRLGNPLSPYLFILYAEGLAAMIKKAVDNNIIHGIKFVQWPL